VIRTAALVAAALFCAGCFHAEEDRKVARYLVYTKGSGPGRTIWIGDVDGRRMRRLARGAEPLVAPDGSSVAFHRCRDAWACQAEGDPRLYTISPDGGDPRLVGRGQFVYEWFPDSRHLLTVEATLDKVDSESGKRTVLARPAREVQGWSIAPDGHAVVFAVSAEEGRRSDCERRVDLLVVDAGGDEEARRLTNDGLNNDPVWGGDTIAFAREEARRPKCIGNPSSGIWTIRPDGSELRPIVAASPRRFSWNGYYGLMPFGWVAGRPIFLAGVRTEWGRELTLIDTRRGWMRAVDLDPRPRFGAPLYVDQLSRDGRYVLAHGCGAEYPCTISIYSVVERRARDLITGRVGSPHWNR
jgi:dipeptidyl aminopeptidase/acylaminoacyl peptidase